MDNIFITLENTDWTEIVDLTDSETYLLQAKRPIVSEIAAEKTKKYKLESVLFSRNGEKPTDTDSGYLSTDYKFTYDSSKKIYIRALENNVQIYGEKIS